MLTDRAPTTESSDEYIRGWVISRGLQLPIIYVPLITANRDDCDTAEINCSIPGWPVRRFKKNSSHK